ncbi:hypothetical protein EV186_102467 [Labedaea rhizosphaerae]|uniref:Tetratricopeptide repeat protein n=1 Tax=Labedaea rhizosphaerae TaxID=598644 RepID=A0A4R6SGX6_LABRH|nr:hypothetical protein EV186_102467 [Labedaea rhizosphaerae]
MTDRLAFDEAIEVERRADKGSRSVRLSLLRRAGRLDELRVLAENDAEARKQLDRALIDHGSTSDIVDLARNPTKREVHPAAVDRLAKRRELDSLRMLAAEGDSLALLRAAELLVSDSRFTDAVDLLRAHDTERCHVHTLVHALVLDGRATEAIDELRQFKPALIDLLVHLRRSDEVRALADSSTSTTAPRIVNNARIAMAWVLHDENRTDEAIALLQQSAELPDPYGHRSVALAELLADAGHVDEALTELRRIDVEFPEEAERRNNAIAARILVRAGRRDELRQLADEGSAVANHELGKLLRDDGQIDEAARRFVASAKGGEYVALVDLAVMVIDHESLAGYQGLLEDYVKGAPWIGFDLRAAVAKKLAEQDRVDDLRRASKAGKRFADQFLAALLAFHHTPEMLARDAVSGDGPSLQALRLLAATGFLAHAGELRRFGLTPRGDIALDTNGTKAATPTLIRTPRREELILLADLAL